MKDSLKLAKELGISDNLIGSMQFLDWSKIHKLTKKCHNSFSCMKKQDSLTRLAVCLCYGVTYTKPFYEKNNIPTDVFYDSLSDIRIWTENTGNKGIDNYRWVQNCLKCELFRLGRLQFQMCPIRGIVFYKKLPISRGDTVLNVHIPRGEKLDLDECKKSVEQARIFFAEYFPDYKYTWFYCNSWLLYKKNREFMAEDSNIIRFQSLFNIVYSFPLDVQPIEILFGGRKKNKSDYQENTALQKNAKQYMISGGKMGIGIGTFK